MKNKSLKVLAGIYYVAMFGYFISACSKSTDGPSCGVTTSATGQVISNLKAKGTGGGAPFDGIVNTASDLDALVETAWGDGSLDLHRGHAPIQNVLESYLGISHNQMHTMMEGCDLNLDGVCKSFGFNSENLIQTLTQSFVPYIEEGVKNGVITSDKVTFWTEKVKTQFSNRVYWKG